MYVVSYSPSPAYIPLLRHIAENDPVQELREDARDMLDAYTEAGIGSAEGGAGASSTDMALRPISFSKSGVTLAMEPSPMAR